MGKRVIDVKVLPGEPTDGSGKVAIHLFVFDDNGPYVEPSAIHMVEGKLVSKATRGRLACDPKRTAHPIIKKGVTLITPRTNDPRAVTCPKCQRSSEYVEMMASITTSG